MKTLDPILDNVTDWLFPVCSTGIGMFFLWLVTHTDEFTVWLLRP